MTTGDQRELLGRVEAFRIDDPDASFSFTRRLARENGWSLPYARRVVREYLRFAFLAVASGHPVSPSDAVDQAWHLHLVYTESYWNKFCREVLRAPLHHQPTKGGPNETEKFGAWRTKTLASYREFFGQEPPADIWPPPGSAEKIGVPKARVDLNRHWVVPKPRFFRRDLPSLAILGGLLLLVVLGCQTDRTDLMSTLLGGDWATGNFIANMPGPAFAAFYLAVVVLGVFACAWIVRRRDPSRALGRLEMPAQPDPYEIAYLRGGADEVMRLAIFSLVRSGHLRTAGPLAAPSSPPLVRRGTPLQHSERAPRSQLRWEMERAVFDSFATPASAGALFEDTLPGAVSIEGERIQEWSEREHLLARTPTRKSARGVAKFELAVILGLGAYKFCVAMARGYTNVGFLLLTGLGSIPAVLLAGRLPRLSWRGRDFLVRLRRASRESRAGSQDFSPDSLLLGISLFGLGTAAGPDDPLVRIGRPARKPGGLRDSGCGGSGCGHGMAGGDDGRSDSSPSHGCGHVGGHGGGDGGGHGCGAGGGHGCGGGGGCGGGH